MKYKFHTCDVFTEEIFGGNQLAVFPEAEGIEPERMQQIAREFNLSETVFVLPSKTTPNTFAVRIFTPAAEIPFAGHPTIGTAFVLAETGRLFSSGTEIRMILEEKVGPVPVSVRFRNGRPYFAQLSAAQPPEFRQDVPEVLTLAEALSLEKPEILTEPFSPEAVSCGVPFLFVPLANRNAIGRIKLNLQRWSERIANSWAPNIFVFTDEAVNADFRARMFAPSLGIAEDPATGGAAAAFAGYLAKRSDEKNAHLIWTLEQGVEMGRPSKLHIEADIQNGAISAIRVGGSAVMVSEGYFMVP